MELPIASDEQNSIIEQLLLNNNVVIDSVAGSGKTTCNLHIANHFHDMHILLLTYNSKLKIETRERVTKLNIKNIEIHSYHSFCVKYYDHKCFTDSIINKIINKKNNPLREFNYDLIVLDEAQDISSLYYELICKIYKDNNSPSAKICIFGDKNQSIFSFNGADQRYIEYGNKLFNFNTFNWARCNLSVSFRITEEMSFFINKCLLHNDRIISHKPTGNKPRYIICDCFSAIRTFNEVTYYLDLGYKPSDIFILGPSIKSNGERLSPIRALENIIKKKLPDVMVYVPMSDDAKLDEELLEGKLIFSTFHQTKGMERKVIIIFNFDESYFQFYNKNANPYICTNELYVATTRGIEHLSLFHHYKSDYLPFIDKAKIPQYCNFEVHKRCYVESSRAIENINTPVTDLIKYLPQSVIDYCYDELDITQNNSYIISTIDIPLKIKGDTAESVCEITALSILSGFELKKINKIDIFNELIEKDFEEEIIKKSSDVLPNKIYNLNNINIQNLNVGELLYISNCYNSYKTGLLYKIYQILTYDWLDQIKLDECIDRLNHLNISNNFKIEYKLTNAKNEKELLNRKLVGRIDSIDIANNIIYEFKCVQKLEKEHYLQLALYMYMYELEKSKAIPNLLIDKENINNELSDNKEKLIEYEQFFNKKINEHNYSIGDIIKYKSSDAEAIGTIIKIYKNGNIVLDKKIKISKKDVIFIQTHVEMPIIEKINNKMQLLNNKLIDIDSLLSQYDGKTKYVLFNILTNEYINIDCEIEKLSKMVEYLIHSKYANDVHITDEQFFTNNKLICEKYFEHINISQKVEPFDENILMLSPNLEDQIIEQTQKETAEPLPFIEGNKIKWQNT